MSESAQCVILVGGAGSRLGEAVRRTPKPMLEIGGRPFLALLMEMFRRQGFDDFLLLAGYRAERIEEYFSDQSVWPEGARVRIMAESAPLGTAGAVRAALEVLEPHFLLTNGDSLCLCDYAALCRPLSPEGVWGRLALRPVSCNDRYGEVLTENGLVTGFRERAAQGAAGLMNAGLYYLSRQVIQRLPEGPLSLEREVFPSLAAEGRLAGYEAGETYFIDIGVPDDLARARRELPSIVKRSKVFSKNI